MSDALDPFHAHEVLHTAAIIAELFEQRIEQHRYTRSQPALRTAAERLTEQLNDFYQLVGRTTLA